MSGEINPNKDYISNNKYGLQKADFAKNSVLQKIFDFFDVNKDGEWDNDERKSFLGKFREANNSDGHNSIFTGQEAFLKSAVDSNEKSLFDQGLRKDDFNEFLKIYANEYCVFIREAPNIQVVAVDFLNEKTESAEQTLEERDEAAGVVSEAVNFWHEHISGYEKSEQYVQNAIISAKNDVIELEKCYGTDGRFEHKFKEQRGVEFDKTAINECKQKANEYAQIKSLYELINYLKQEFIKFGRCNSRAELGKKLVQAFEICGIKGDKEINQVLEQIFEANKEKFDNVSGGNGSKFYIRRNQKNEPVLYRLTRTGPTDATNDQIHLFTDELIKMMEKQFLNHCGVLTQGKLSEEELAQKTEEELNKNKSEYEKSFKKAFGDKDVSILAEQYVLKEQQSVENINMVLDIISMATMFIPGGALVKGLGYAAKGLEAANAGQKVVKTVNAVKKAAEAYTSYQKMMSLPAMAQLTVKPLELAELVTSGNATGEDWLNYLTEVGQNVTFMAAGAGASRIAQEVSSAFRMKAIMKVFKGAGKGNLKNVDDILKNLPESVTKDEALVQAFRKVEKQAIALQIPLEAAIDLTSSYYLTEEFYGEGLKTQDWLMSIGYALAGGTLQKEFIPLNTEAKINKLKKHFKDGMSIELTEEQVRKILQTMDEVTSGELETKGKKMTEEEFKQAKADLKQRLLADKDFSKDQIVWILDNTNEQNIEAKIQIYNKLCADKDFQKEEIARILFGTNKQNIALADKLCADKDFPKKEIAEILSYTNKQNIALAEKLCADKDFPKDQIAEIILRTNEQNIALAEKLCDDKDFQKEEIARILSSTNKQNIEAKIQIYDKLCADKDFQKEEIARILECTNEQNIEAKIQIYDKLCADKDFPKKEIAEILSYTNKQNIALAEKLCADKDFPKDQIAEIILRTNKQNIALAEKLCADKDFQKEEIARILFGTNKQNIALAEKLCADKDFPKKEIVWILRTTNEQNIEAKIQIYDKLCADKDFQKEEIARILDNTNEQNISLAEKLCADKEILTKIPNDYISKILRKYVSNTDDTIIRMIKDGTLENTPELLNYDTDCWENIIERDLLNNQVSFPNGVRPFPTDALIHSYAKCKDKNIVKVHQQLLNDALANKDILKSGIDDITDEEICATAGCVNSIETLDLIGIGNTEAAFPLMLDEFSEFVSEIGNIKLSDSNKELVLQKINPQNSQKYAQLNQEITNLKKSLNEVIGKDNLSKIQDLQKQKAEIDEKIKKLKQSDNANTPDGKKQLKELQQQSKSLGSQIQSIYCQSESAKALMNDINTKSKELKNFVNENAGIEPQEVVTKMRVLAALTEISTESEIAEFIEMIKISTPENEVKWNEAVNRKIFQKLNVEFDEELSKKLDLINCKYVSKLFISSDKFFTNMQKLVYVIKNNPELTIEQAIDMMPQNIETKRIFDELGFDYNKFTKVDKNSYTSVEIKLSAEEAKQMSIHNLEEDLNDALFQSLPKDVTEPIFKSLEKELGVTFVKSQRDNWVGYGFDAGTTEYYRLYKNGKPIAFEDMDGIVSLIKKEILSNNFWTTTHPDANVDNARGTMYTHLIKMRTQEVDNAISIKNGETAEIEVRKTDMYDIKKALGLGNDAQCCTALGRNFNEWSAPTYIMNKCIGAIELTDKNNFVGNTMIYLAYVDGKPALVLDNIELKTKYQNNDKIRDTFVEYAKKLCEEIGQPDLPIFAGPNRHKLNMDIYPKEMHTMKIIGNSGEDYVYVDYDAGHHVIGKGEVANISMYKLR